MVMSIQILGSPAPKGSSRAILRGGRALHVPGGSSANQRAIKSWDASVRHAAAEKVGKRTAPVYVGVPLSVSLVFRLRRPSGHWGKAGGVKPSSPNVPLVKPDLDKLARATLDALTGILWDDDARIVHLACSKVYAEPGNEGALVGVAVWA